MGGLISVFLRLALGALEQAPSAVKVLRLLNVADEDEDEDEEDEDEDE